MSCKTSDLVSSFVVALASSPPSGWADPCSPGGSKAVYLDLGLLKVLILILEPELVPELLELALDHNSGELPFSVGSVNLNEVKTTWCWWEFEFILCRWEGELQLWVWWEGELQLWKELQLELELEPEVGINDNESYEAYSYL